MSAAAGSIVALSGGVGGAKLALGLSRVLEPARLVIVANTGDDFEHLGLHVSPDLDTIMYTLAGVVDPDTGWGRAGDTATFMAALAGLGGETWFHLGDADLATHVERTRRLAAGETLSAITADLCARLGVGARIAPMSDDAVRTVVATSDGPLAFQHYFVREDCRPAVSGFRFAGAETALPNPAFLAAVGDAAAVVICPSNPFISIDPILALAGVRDALAGSSAPVVAVSPVVGGRAVKGPTTKIMRELGLPETAATVARHYAGLIDGFVLDRADAAAADELRGLGIETEVADTVMRDLADKEALARGVIAFAESLADRTGQRRRA